MITRKDIIKAYSFLRTHENSIPDETLDFIKKSAIDNLNKIQNIERAKVGSDVLADNVDLHDVSLASQTVESSETSVEGALASTSQAKEDFELKITAMNIDGRPFCFNCNQPFPLKSD